MAKGTEITATSNEVKTSMGDEGSNHVCIFFSDILLLQFKLFLPSAYSLSSAV